MNNKIAIIDYDTGNIKSIMASVARSGNIPLLTRDKQEILAADKIILPGVGAFAKAMAKLHNYGLVDVLHECVIVQKKMILGICLGMQLLCEESEEFCITKGLGFIKGSVKKINIKSGIKLPHIGWNKLIKPHSVNWENTVLGHIAQSCELYFVHSFAVNPKNPLDIMAYTSYGGYEFPSVICRNNIIGCQFHPEKSRLVGLQIIDSFCHGKN